MNALTSNELPNHELIGLKVRVVHSVNPSHAGIEGMVVNETRNTQIIANGSGKKCLPKEGVTYRFTLCNEALVEVDGGQLIERPVDRTGKRFERRKA